MVAGGGCSKKPRSGIDNNAFCPVGPEGPAFCLWEVREGITAEEFQAFIDGPNGVNFGLGALMNICKEINVEDERKSPVSKIVLKNLRGLALRVNSRCVGLEVTELLLLLGVQPVFSGGSWKLRTLLSNFLLST